MTTMTERTASIPPPEVPEAEEHDRAAPEPQPKTVWTRGHGPKILEALRSAETRGLLPANPRPVEFRKIISDELDELGYRSQAKPSRTAIDVRYAAVYRRQ